jgi:hypothetical protein
MSTRVLISCAALALAAGSLAGCASNEGDGAKTAAVPYERPYTPTGSNVPRRDPSQVPTDVKSVDKSEADKLLNRPRGTPGGG